MRQRTVFSFVAAAALCALFAASGCGHHGCLAHRHGYADVALVHSRFHPVPTRSVFPTGHDNFADMLDEAPDERMPSRGKSSLDRRRHLPNPDDDAEMRAKQREEQEAEEQPLPGGDFLPGNLLPGDILP